MYKEGKPEFGLCDSSEELAVSHHTSCNTWALWTVGGGPSVRTGDNSLLVELWCGCWMAPELTIIDE